MLSFYQHGVACLHNTSSVSNKRTRKISTWREQENVDSIVDAMRATTSNNKIINITKHVLKSSEKDKKEVTMYLKKRLQAVADDHKEGTSPQQYLELPRPIAA